MNGTTVICLTPVKNERWILDQFLSAASLWADVIFVADQQSDDGSREIVRRHPKARLVENLSNEYDESHRQKLLLSAARTVPGRRVLIALDADEFLAPGTWQSDEWSSALSAHPGTVIRFPWLNVRPDLLHYWCSADPMPFGFVDDETDHVGSWIHSPRIPARPDAPVMEMSAVTVLHLQYIDWRRMESKHRWYQCLERLKDPGRSPIDIYRQYHHMDAVPANVLHVMPPHWMADYQEMGVDLRSVERPEWYRWDREVLGLFEEFSTSTFTWESIWDVNWADVADHFGLSGRSDLKDPRGLAARALHRWLTATQPRSGGWAVRQADRVVRRLIGG